MTACTAATTPVAIPRTPRYDNLSFDAGGILLFAPPQAPKTTIRVVDNALMNGDKALTPRFKAIDSFSVSDVRKEVVFSAKRNDNFDIGLVSVDGSEIHWVPEDPHDEVNVQWAPRGNKFSYIVRTPAGDFVRTVHAPTAVQVVSDFPNGRVHAVAWEPKGERYAAAWESVDASDRVEIMTYEGAQRTLAKPPAMKLDVAIETLPGAYVLRPNLLQYNEQLPLVVWVQDDINRWDDDRGWLESRTRIACAVTPRADDAFWAEIGKLKWIDRNRVWVVGATVVKSEAAGSIASQLKGTPPANGSH